MKRWCAWAGILFGCSSSSEPAPEPTPVYVEQPGQAAPELAFTGLYADFSAKTLATGVRPYAPAVHLWSDGADKDRWVFLPPGSKIDTSNMDDWQFPVGTKFWKEFRFAGKRIETRFYYKQSASRWVWATYLWSDDEKKAAKVTTSMRNVVGTYEIPDSVGCEKCHRGRKDRILGFEAMSLGLPGATGVTLDVLAREGFLSAPPAKTQLAYPDDGTGKAGPALGWLHTNCGVSCHNRTPDAEGALSSLFTRLSVADVSGGTVQGSDTFKTAVRIAVEDAKYGSYATQGFSRIKPGDSQKSLLVELARLRDAPGQMPPFYTHVADSEGSRLLSTWIDAMQP